MAEYIPLIQSSHGLFGLILALVNVSHWWFVSIHDPQHFHKRLSHANNLSDKLA
jgi:hypothetical protein